MQDVKTQGKLEGKPTSKPSCGIKSFWPFQIAYF